ncbi:MAG: MarR family transcriptional regulator [Acidimicrobiales bacterium]
MTGQTRSRDAAKTVEPLAPDSPEARIGVAWRELRRGASMQAMRDRLYGDLLDPAQVDALDVVHVGAKRMSELAEALRVDASTATRTVDRLVANGLLRRTSAPDDRRVVVVEMTPAGRRLHERLSRRRRVMLLSVLEEFDPDERLALAELLERLVRGVDRYVTGR